MTNYDKKRKRQNGRQEGGGESERTRQYRQGYYDGQSALIERFTEAGILPPVTFNMEPKTQDEFKKDFS